MVDYSTSDNTPINNKSIEQYDDGTDDESDRAKYFPPHNNQLVDHKTIAVLPKTSFNDNKIDDMKNIINKMHKNSANENKSLLDNYKSIKWSLTEEEQKKYQKEINNLDNKYETFLDNYNYQNDPTNAWYNNQSGRSTLQPKQYVKNETKSLNNQESLFTSSSNQKISIDNELYSRNEELKNELEYNKNISDQSHKKQLLDNFYSNTLPLFIADINKSRQQTEYTKKLKEYWENQLNNSKSQSKDDSGIIKRGFNFLWGENNSKEIEVPQQNNYHNKHNNYEKIEEPQQNNFDIKHNSFNLSNHEVRNNGKISYSF